MFSLRRKSRRKTAAPFSLPTILLYAAILTGGMLAIQWLDFGLYTLDGGKDWQIGIAAFIFLCLGIWLGARLFSRHAAQPVEAGNPRARAALGISDREYEVLQVLAKGLSNKEIASELRVSPNTIKTHIARLLEKLEANRRTEAVARARELGILD